MIFWFLSIKFVDFFCFSRLIFRNMLSLGIYTLFLISQVSAFPSQESHHDDEKPIIAQVWDALKPAGNASFPAFRKRADGESTCGFDGGVASLFRTAAPGFDCRFDTAHGLWGFCPTTVISATDCGLAGNCVDSNTCTDGCGMTGVAGITTFTWYGTLSTSQLTAMERF